MLVNSKSMIIFIIIFVLSVPINGICASADSNKSAVKEGYKLVEKFYDCVVSGVVTDTCNNIFYIATYRDANEISSLWSYIKNNKKLFMPKNLKINERDFFKISRKAVSFYNPRNVDDIFSGQLYISIVHTLSDEAYSGIHKEISFPIIKDENNGDYKIQFFNIKINGIIIDYDGNFVRNFDLIKLLGFDSSQIK